MKILSFPAFAFVFIFILMVNAIYLSFQNYTDLISNFNLVEGTYEHINRLEKIEQKLSDADAESKSYFGLEEKNNIAKFNTLSSGILKSLDQINDLSNNNPAQRTNIRDLKKLIRQKLALLNLVFIYREKPGASYKTLASVTNNALKLNGQIFKLITKIKDLEKTHLHNRQKETLHNLKISKRLIFMFTGTFLITGVLMLIFIDRDIKRRKYVENELRELNENKNKFFSIISHDLRGPIISARQLSELLNQKNSTLQGESKEISEMMEYSIKNVAVLLDDLLEWSRIQMNKIDLNPEVININSLIKEVIDNYQSNADNKNITITNLVNSNVTAMTDKYMTLTILRNLINNAIKFSYPDKNITLFSGTEADGFISISVKDEGVGINEKQKETLFKLGKKRSTKGTNLEEGSGIGLILCKEFTEKLGGKIRVTSAPGKGSTFTFTLPPPQDT